MLMTACDIAAITKPWEVQRRVSFEREIEGGRSGGVKGGRGRRRSKKKM
jgi:hypothetical protein